LDEWNTSFQCHYKGNILLVNCVCCNLFPLISFAFQQFSCTKLNPRSTNTKKGVSILFEYNFNMCTLFTRLQRIWIICNKVKLWPLQRNNIFRHLSLCHNQH
jgi:hypothetical protein